MIIPRQSFIFYPFWRAWSGYAFESLCRRHIPQIKDALGITARGIKENSQALDVVQSEVPLDALFAPTEE